MEGTRWVGGGIVRCVGVAAGGVVVVTVVAVVVDAEGKGIEEEEDC